MAQGGEGGGSDFQDKMMEGRVQKVESIEESLKDRDVVLIP